MPDKIIKFSPDRYSYLIRSLGFKKKDVAERAGFKPSELSRYLTGQTEPKGPRLEALANAIGVTVQDITEEAAGEVYCSVIELEFTISGLKNIIRDGQLYWSTNIDHIKKEKCISRHEFELPDLYAPDFLRYIATGLDIDRPARSKSDIAAAELLAKAARSSRQDVDSRRSACAKQS